MSDAFALLLDFYIMSNIWIEYWWEPHFHYCLEVVRFIYLNNGVGLLKRYYTNASLLSSLTEQVIIYIYLYHWWVIQHIYPTINRLNIWLMNANAHCVVYLYNKMKHYWKSNTTFYQCITCYNLCMHHVAFSTT